uniref:Uncharacterized protein n=1 Tax=Homalodisca liturata TaxID=320908 RepID=A0A1B6J7R1_9HEMI
MDNHIELESHDKSNSNKKIVLQQGLVNNGFSSLAEGQLDNDPSENNAMNSNECEVVESLIHKISPISKVYGLICEDDELCHEKCGLTTNETSGDNKNSQQTDNSTSDLEKRKFIDDKQLNSGSVNMNSTDNIGFVDAKVQNCIEPGSTKAVEMGCHNSSPCGNTETAGTSNTEQLLPVQHPLLGKSLINPNPSVFDMIQENVLPHYGVSLLNTNDGTDLMSLETDKSVVISNNNAIPQAESIVTSNFSLNLLKSYDTDDSSEGEACEASFQYREDKNEEDSDRDSDSDSSSSSSSTSIIISDSSDSDSDELYENFNVKPCKPIKAKKEISLEDLPPIEDLKISVPEEDCTPIGKIQIEIQTRIHHHQAVQLQ